ncbi:prohead protease/major capsid protein fusion protein [Neorhizobium sp. JUb45]|uniref:prohead protease/major capsid protein fusion protein n=1 Tax=Neorhizobium sp. JUb45 TaxID=2485113 RepID=UPI0010490C91|nr:prohead protease/major capsid protein fusion protein [Neorhizobium sp. JUb45]TCR07259.1 hypothetical protein EDF70_1011232 [Neorhizobium sp. JUb45]
MTLREKLALLEKRAADKLAEIKDDTAADAARTIEKDHEGILAEIAEVRKQIAAADAAEDATRAAPRQDQTQPVDVDAAIRKALDTEHKRASEIRTLAKEAGEAELGDEHIDKRSSVENFRSALLEKMMKREAPATDNRSPASVGEEHHEKRASAMREALAHRADPSKPLGDGGREYRGFSLMDMARESLETRGVKTRGMSRDEIAGAALAQRSGYGSTSDFPIILGNVVNTTLRAGYEAAGQTFRPLIRETTVADFKAINRAQLGEGPAFDKVSESGEFKRGTVAEGKESYKIATFGKVIAITRQVIINDDMNAFSRIPQLMGGAAAQLESDLVWAQILSNPTMGDGQTLFSAPHKNVLTAAAFGVASLGKGRAQMAKQVGLDGKTVLNIRPQFLVVPVELETTAEQVLKSTFFADDASKVATESMRKLQIIAEARLDNGISNPAAVSTAIAGSTTAWYLAASPAQVDTVELAYLEGNRGVYIETRQGFDVDGLEVKARLDVGAKAMDHRGLAKNAGA